MSRFSLNDYAQAMMNLLPSGIAWNKNPDSVQYRLILALAEALKRSDEDACALIAGAFPETADAMIDEWYISLGLDDDCGSLNAGSNDEAIKYILAKLLYSGGQSVPYFVQLAASLGYEITIREYRVPLCGFSWCGQPLGKGTNFHWTVIVSYPEGEAADRQYLECIFNKYAPAHTSLTFIWLARGEKPDKPETPVWPDGPGEPPVVSGGDPMAVNRTNFMSGYKTQDPLQVNRSAVIAGYKTTEPVQVNRASVISCFKTQEPTQINRAYLNVLLRTNG
ncbi:putative phage tail protein [Escherichia coli]|uniref:putative phage tail protein n=1 Tax=Escherichia coli TaxID=562 RepID=UPI001F0FCFA0|nr:putative phage tail protein [Escherichia coli]UMR99558.1 hypothetical protein AOY87_15725 [Escherichia coli]